MNVKELEQFFIEHRRAHPRMRVWDGDPKDFKDLIVWLHDGSDRPFACVSEDAEKDFLNGKNFIYDWYKNAIDIPKEGKMRWIVTKINQTLIMIECPHCKKQMHAKLDPQDKVEDWLSPYCPECGSRNKDVGRE